MRVKDRYRYCTISPNAIEWLLTISSCCVSASKVYYWCLSAINCTGKNMSGGLLYALGQADAYMYICSKELRPSENQFYLLFA